MMRLKKVIYLLIYIFFELGSSNAQVYDFVWNEETESGFKQELIKRSSKGVIQFFGKDSVLIESDQGRFEFQVRQEDFNGQKTFYLKEIMDFDHIAEKLNKYVFESIIKYLIEYEMQPHNEVKLNSNKSLAILSDSRNGTKRWNSGLYYLSEIVMKDNQIIKMNSGYIWKFPTSAFQIESEGTLKLELRMK